MVAEGFLALSGALTESPAATLDGGVGLKALAVPDRRAPLGVPNGAGDVTLAAEDRHAPGAAPGGCILGVPALPGRLSTPAAPLLTAAAGETADRCLLGVPTGACPASGDTAADCLMLEPAAGGIAGAGACLGVR